MDGRALPLQALSFYANRSPRLNDQDRIFQSPVHESLPMKITKSFNRLAQATARFTGNPISFCLATAIVVAWAVTGPLFGFSETWQLVINTGTTIVTFLMVFLIQNTQNRDTVAMQIKLDELIHVTRLANDELLDLEEMEGAELDQLRLRYENMARRAKEKHDEKIASRHRHR